ncbi:MAG: amidohydrolase [Acidobacteriaceae bacterium]|nr:amidohydrolase [Acidobacteriaceae bacterium]
MDYLVRCIRTTACCILLHAASAWSQQNTPADTIYLHGNVITVNDAQPKAEAVAVAKGQILAVGTDQQILAYKAATTRVVDLHGKTMLPGFVDGHSHFTMVAALWGIPNLNPPPVGSVRTVADIQHIMREHIAAHPPKPGEFAYAFGYDDAELAEHRHPMRQDLDAITTTYPLCLQHASGHLATCNSLALKTLGYDRNTPDPEGGKLFHDPSTGELNGVLADAAAAGIRKFIPPPSPQQMAQSLQAAQTYYAGFGYTTVQDGATGPADMIKMLQTANSKGLLKLDVIAYPVYAGADAFVSQLGITFSKQYTGHLKFQGVKVFADGSPQGKTAWFTTAYVHPPDGASNEYRGFPNMSQEQMDAVYDHAYSKDWQVITHANGDAAIDEVLNALQKAEAKYGANDRRPVIIHSQVMRPDQFDRYVQLHVFPSFFEAHTFYWGDWHRKEILGEQRAAYISPLHSALDHHILFSLHSDAPIIPPNPMMLWWCAVNRKTRSGFVLGPDQRIDAMTALKALTLWPAYQQFDDNIKGSIEPGKYADFVLLEEDPLKANPDHLREIRVLETIKQDEVLYKREP